MLLLETIRLIEQVGISFLSVRFYIQLRTANVIETYILLGENPVDLSAPTRLPVLSSIERVRDVRCE